MVKVLRDSLHDGHVIVSGPEKGMIKEKDVIADLAVLDAAVTTLSQLQVAQRRLRQSRRKKPVR